MKSINLNTSTNGITILKNIPVNKEYNLNKNLPSGIYILSIEYTDGRISSKKLLIQ
ncbi:MAG: T9SS type A sorting domain-containing protein [Saprospiraceae bacterium]|nr:T9SS type A sorting domain-containing protein [Saprospiraceae bacterium]